MATENPRDGADRGPVETCSHCGGPVKIIADTSDRCIEDKRVIDKILAHRNAIHFIRFMYLVLIRKNRGIPTFYQATLQ